MYSSQWCRWPGLKRGIFLDKQVLTFEIRKDVRYNYHNIFPSYACYVEKSHYFITSSFLLTSNTQSCSPMMLLNWKSPVWSFFGSFLFHKYAREYITYSITIDHFIVHLQYGWILPVFHLVHITYTDFNYDPSLKLGRTRKYSVCGCNCLKFQILFPPMAIVK